MTNSGLIEMTYSGDRSAGNLTPQMPSGQRYQYGGTKGVVQADPRDVETLRRLGFAPRQVAQQSVPQPAQTNPGDQVAGANNTDADGNTDQSNTDDEPSIEFLIDAGISEQTAQNLFAAGYTDAGAIRSASDEELRDVDGVGLATLEKLKAL